MKEIPLEVGIDINDGDDGMKMDSGSGSDRTAIQRDVCVGAIVKMSDCEDVCSKLSVVIFMFGKSDTERCVLEVTCGEGAT